MCHANQRCATLLLLPVVETVVAAATGMCGAASSLCRAAAPVAAPHPRTKVLRHGRAAILGIHPKRMTRILSFGREGC